MFDERQVPVRGVVVNGGGGSNVSLEWGVVVGELEDGFKATCLTCAGGGASLTSLREGRRHAAALLRRPQAPAIVDNHPHASQL